MREEKTIFDRRILTEDTNSYNNVFGKDLIINSNDNISNILEELEDGHSFIIKGEASDGYDTRYSKISGNLYKNVVVDGEIKLKQLDLEEIL